MEFFEIKFDENFVGVTAGYPDYATKGWHYCKDKDTVKSDTIKTEPPQQPIKTGKGRI